MVLWLKTRLTFTPSHWVRSGTSLEYTPGKSMTKSHIGIGNGSYQSVVFNARR
jgi:hypothetical protein